MQAPKSTGEVFRIFVGGLSYDVDNHLLKESFHKFGSLKKALVIRDQRTGQSKGYGFVTFSARHSFEAALRSTVIIEGMQADCHPVLTKGALRDQEQRDMSNKLFVGGISQQVYAEDLRRYFAQFGRIREARILYDGKTGKSRGFGFVLFDSAAEVESVLAVGIHKIKKKPVEVKRFNKDKDEEYQLRTEKQRHLQPRDYHEGPQHSESTSFDPESTRVARQKRRKAQKVKQTSLESLSTISEKETYNHYFDAQCSDENNHFECNDRLEADSHYEELAPMRQAPVTSNSKPNFTLSGFFSYTQSFEPFKTQRPFSIGNSLGPIGAANFQSDPQWSCQNYPGGPAWTPYAAASQPVRRSRPAPPGPYKY